jgi:hypothetical protein
MPKYTVHLVKTYSITIETETEDDALHAALNIDLDQWEDETEPSFYIDHEEA